LARFFSFSVATAQGIPSVLNTLQALADAATHFGGAALWIGAALQSSYLQLLKCDVTRYDLLAFCLAHLSCFRLSQIHAVCFVASQSFA
jgi:hypothetical protein